MTCSIEDCGAAFYARGWCRKHYQRWRKNGDPIVLRGPARVRKPAVDVALGLPDRFWAKVAKTETCWLWTSALTKGYGVFSMKVSDQPNDRKTFWAHRLAYEASVGPIPAGLHLDHLCRVTNCVRPDHLEPVTPLENARRGMAPTMISKLTGLCFQGHRMTPENTYTKPATGYRQCRICMSAYGRARRARGAA